MGRLAHLHVAHDVLAHHDGVVDQQAHAQAQRHQRDHVDGEAEQVHEQEGADERDRQRQPGDDGASARSSGTGRRSARSAARLRSGCAARCPPPRGSARAVAHHDPGARPGAVAAAVRPAPFAGRRPRRWCFRPGLLHRQQQVRWPLYSARESISCGPSTTVGHLAQADRRAVARGHDDDPKSSGRRMRASICTTRSCASERTRPWAGPGSRCARRWPPGRA
jgi:hypothetical protein